jgi:hypothetical protein
MIGLLLSLGEDMEGISGVSRQKYIRSVSRKGQQQGLKGAL